MKEKAHVIKLKWTNYEDWKKYIESIRRVYGNATMEQALNFRFEFNHGQVRLSNE